MQWWAPSRLMPVAGNARALAQHTRTHGPCFAVLVLRVPLTSLLARRRPGQWRVTVCWMLLQRAGARRFQTDAHYANLCRGIKRMLECICPNGSARHSPPPLQAAPARMGRGGDGRLDARLRRRIASSSSSSLQQLGEMTKGLQNDMTVLRNIWFGRAWKGAADHASRLESFYGPQAAACGSGGPAAAAAALAAPAAPGGGRCLAEMGGGCADRSVERCVHPTAPARSPPQTTSSAPTSCGGASRCWPRARPACRARPT